VVEKRAEYRAQDAKRRGDPTLILTSKDLPRPTAEILILRADIGGENRNHA